MIALGVYLLVVVMAMMMYLGPLDETWNERYFEMPTCFLACALAGLPLFAALCIVMRPR